MYKDTITNLIHNNTGTLKYESDQNEHVDVLCDNTDRQDKNQEMFISPSMDTILLL